MNLVHAMLGGAMIVAAVASACGGDAGDETDSTPADGGTPAASATSGTGATAPPAATQPPADTETPTVAPSATPEPTPTPAVLTLDTANAGNGSKTADSNGPFGIVYAGSAFGFNASANRMQASAFVNVGINEKPSATAYLFNPFRVPGEGTAPVTAQISSDVSWRGILAGNGAGGTRAAVTITMSVLEGGRTIASEVVHSEEQRESLLTLGGYDIVGSSPVDLQVLLVPGVYELRLTLTCDAASGFIGVATHCVFGASDLYDEGSVTWGTRTILFSQ